MIMSWTPANIVHVDKFSKPGYQGRHTSYADGMKDTADVSWFHILSPMYEVATPALLCHKDTAQGN